MCQVSAIDPMSALVFPDDKVSASSADRTDRLIEAVPLAVEGARIAGMGGEDDEADEDGEEAEDKIDGTFYFLETWADVMY